MADSQGEQSFILTFASWTDKRYLYFSPAVEFSVPKRVK